MSNELMGPPQQGPWVDVRGDGIRVQLQINDELDQEILDEALRVCNRRRFARNESASEGASK